MKTTHDIAIIGAGFSGLCMAIQLKKAGFHNFVILEKAASIGGTWRDNTYPGAACDVSSHMYSFSFEPNPNWSKMFSGQAEILRYMQHCVTKYDLQKHLIFNSAIATSVFDEAQKTWQISSINGEQYYVKSLISGAGPLNRPKFPNIKNRENFKGTAFHTMQWKHDFSLTGKKVAIIGTGASAIQIIPEIADNCQQLSIFQRTAPWILPKPNRKMLRLEKKLFKTIPFTQKIYRGIIYAVAEFYGLCLYKNANFILRFIENRSLGFLKRNVKDETTRIKATPNFRLGCKRILLSDTYYPTLNKKNVALITNEIEAILPKGIQTKDGKIHHFDCIIYATGYNAADYPKGFKFYGKNGLDLEDAWQDGPEAHLGTMVKDFPNLYFIVGPNVGLGHNSIIYMIEAQVDYILQILETQKKHNFKTTEVKPNIQEKFNIEIQEKLKDTVWASGCNSWYTTDNNKNTTIWPGFTFQYKNKVKKLNKEEYFWE